MQGKWYAESEIWAMLLPIGKQLLTPKLLDVQEKITTVP